MPQKCSNILPQLLKIQNFLSLSSFFSLSLTLCLLFLYVGMSFRCTFFSYSSSTIVKALSNYLLVPLSVSMFVCIYLVLIGPGPMHLLSLHLFLVLGQRIEDYLHKLCMYISYSRYLSLYQSICPTSVFIFRL